VTVAIIDYGSGNLHSAAKAFERATRGMENPEKIVVTRDPDQVFRADRIVLPGVGAFADCRRGLNELDGMVQAMTEAVRDKARPFFGICVGMQLMADTGEELGTHPGLGWVSGTVRAIAPASGIRVPHMGWNDVVPTLSHPLIEPGQAYFLHSFAFTGDAVLATTDHGGPVTAAIGRDNMIGVQFHPEKSQRYGIALMERFLAWHP
jgi:glutamine amidotransferase